VLRRAAEELVVSDTEDTGAPEGAPAPPSADPANDMAAEAARVLEGILERMGLRARVFATEDAEHVRLDISGPEAGLIIGKQGQTLDALQYLVRRIVGRPGDTKSIVLDSEGYRDRREDALVEMAYRLAEKVQQTGRPLAVEPMSAHDRRIIHITLDKFPGVATRSEGEGVHRRLLIVPAPDKR
jgi:spoIIIJ-associated protein